MIITHRRENALFISLEMCNLITEWMHSYLEYNPIYYYFVVCQWDGCCGILDA